MSQSSVSAPSTFIPDDSGVLRIDGQRLTEPVVIQDVAAHRIEIMDSTFRADVTLIGCTVDVLAIEQVRMARRSALSVQNCKVDRLSIRSVSGTTPVSVQHVRAGSLTVHDVPAVAISTTSVDHLLRLSRLGGFLRISDSSAAQVLVQNLDDPAMEVGFSRFTCNRDIRIESGEMQSIVLMNTTAGDVSIQAVHSAESEQPAISLHDCTVARDILVERVSSLKSYSLHLSDTRLGGSLMLRRLESVGAQHATLERCVVGEDLRLFDLTGDAHLAMLIESDVRHSIVIGEVAELLRVRTTPLLLLSRSRAGDVTIPTERYRGKREIAGVVEQLFGAIEVDSVDLIRNVFRKQHRALSEDAAYALLQELMLSTGSGSRFKRLVYGGILGWGVQVWPPARTLLVSILLTAVALWTAAPSGPLWYRGVTSVINALGLWTNIPTLEVVSTRGALYAAAAGVCGALGIVLVTVIVGVIIRRLVR